MRIIAGTILLAGLLLGDAFGGEVQRLFRVQSDFFKGAVRYLAVDVDDNDEVTSLILQRGDLKPYVYSDFSKMPEGRGGLTLLEIEKFGTKHKVVILYSEDFSTTAGGPVKVSFITNAITGARSSFPAKLQFDDGKWQAYHQGTKIKVVDFVPGTFGVTDVKVNGGSVK